FGCKLVEKRLCLIARALADESTVLAQIIEEPYHEYLDLGLFQQIQELFIVVVTIAVLAVGDQDQRTALPVLRFLRTLVLVDVFDREIYGIANSGLTALDIKIVERVVEVLLIRRERLRDLDLVASNEANDESFVVGTICAYKDLAGLDDLVELLAERTRIVDH